MTEQTISASDYINGAGLYMQRVPAGSDLKLKVDPLCSRFGCSFGSIVVDAEALTARIECKCGSAFAEFRLARLRVYE